MFNILIFHRFSHSIQEIDFIAGSTKQVLSLEEQKIANRTTIAELQALNPYQNQVNIKLLYIK